MDEAGHSLCRGIPDHKSAFYIEQAIFILEVIIRESQQLFSLDVLPGNLRFREPALCSAHKLESTFHRSVHVNVRVRPQTCGRHSPESLSPWRHKSQSWESSDLAHRERAELQGSAEQKVAQSPPPIQTGTHIHFIP